MSKSKLLLALILVLATLASACSSERTGTLLFSDDFSQTTSGWDQIQNDTGSTEYADGSFHIKLNHSNDFLIANIGQTFDGDVSVEVDARKIDGSNDNYFGIVCHYLDEDNFYLLMITSGGYSAIAMMLDGEFGLISPGLAPLPMEGIKLDSANNHLRADCAGEQMTLYANGKQVSVAYDDSITGGRVGLVAATGPIASKLDILFDDFQVYQP
jgi:hypothetical protein